MMTQRGEYSETLRSNAQGRRVVASLLLGKVGHVGARRRLILRMLNKSVLTHSL